MLLRLGTFLSIAYLASAVSSQHVQYNGSKSSFGEDENKMLRLETIQEEERIFDDGDWFVAPPILPISVAASSYIRDPRCRNQSRLFLQQLRNFTLWAVESEYNVIIF